MRSGVRFCLLNNLEFSGKREQKPDSKENIQNCSRKEPMRVLAVRLLFISPPPSSTLVVAGLPSSTLFLVPLYKLWSQMGRELRSHAQNVMDI
uniref:Uncharacterized protein n=1 Tax=Brassica oleracea TaxID=3712 RepID=A0A3P6BQK0_BRAOL|nr:unnamed protein product [Brassica oleracea]